MAAPPLNVIGKGEKKFKQFSEMQTIKNLIWFAFPSEKQEIKSDYKEIIMTFISLSFRTSLFTFQRVVMLFTFIVYPYYYMAPCGNIYLFDYKKLQFTRVRA